MLRSVILTLLPVVLAFVLYKFSSVFQDPGNSELIYVNITDGELFGKRGFSRDGKPYYSFTSVPYAEKPLGNLRFQPPQKNKPFDKILDATKETPICLQVNPIFKTVLGDSDCLYLNIYTPKVQKSRQFDESELLNVMVFIHGGHFQFGDSELHGPQYFMDEDIVFCTMNYRLGALGFLNTGDSIVPGNMGLKDQNMALQWIQENIHAFGGDKRKVTLVGESAGGFSVNLHKISKASEGLFHRAISQSGSSLNPWGFTKNPKEQAKRFGRKLNCNTENSDSLLACLLEKSQEDIVEAQMEIMDIFHPQEAIFAPSIETKESNPNPFLVESPFQLLSKGLISKVPLLTGILPAEGGYRSVFVLLGDDYLRRFNELYYEDIGQRTLILARKECSKEILKKIWEFYFGENQKTIGLKELKNLTNLYSDRYFVNGVRQEALFHAKIAPVYFYQMSYRGQTTAKLIQVAALKGTGPKTVLLHLLLEFLKTKLFNLLNWDQPDFDVIHGDDIIQLFQLNPLLKITNSHPDYKFSKEVVRLWVDFAKDKKPLQFDNIIWEQLQPDQPLKYMDLNKNSQMIVESESFVKRMQFWESLHLIEN